MTTNRLKLNSDKTQFIWLGSRQQLLKVNVVNVQLGDYSVPFQSNVCSHEVHLDSQLTMRTHVLAYLSVVVPPAASAPIDPPIALRDILFSSSPCVHQHLAGLL